MESNNFSNEQDDVNSIGSQDEDDSQQRGSRRLRKKNYEKINDEIRKKIIFEVTVLGNKLKTICEKLNINVSSAKNVLAIYKKEGRIEKKKYRVKRKRGSDDQDDDLNDSNSSSSKINNNVLQPNISSMPTVNSSQSDEAKRSQNNLNLNTLSVYYLFENYWMWPTFSQNLYPLQISAMDEYWKNSLQYMNNFGRF